MEEILLDNEKISVIMAVYNCESTVSSAIDSIISQTYTDWQLIICDDCSTDDTYEIVAKYQRVYPDKIKLIKNSQNMKLPYSLNHCLKYADGKYVARMDGDDLSTSDRFQKQIDFLKAHPDIDLVGGAMEVFDGTAITGVMSRPEKVDKYNFGFNHATIMTYRYVYLKLDGYSLAKRAVRCEDLDLWFRFFAAGFKGANIPDVIYTVTDDENARSRRNFKGRINAMRTLFFGYHLLHYPIYKYPIALNPVIKGFFPRFLYDFFRNKKIK